MEFVKIVLIIIGICATLVWALRQGGKAIARLIVEGGNFVSEIKKATRKAIHKVKNS